MSNHSTSKRRLVWSDISLSLLSLVALGVQGAWNPDGNVIVPWAATLVAVFLAIIAWGLGYTASRAITTLVALMSIAGRAVPQWQMLLAAALGVYALAGRYVPGVAFMTGWKRGTIPRVATLVVGFVTPVALIVWTLLAHPHLEQKVGTSVRHFHIVGVLLGAAAFVLINAACEELVWRGVVQEQLQRAVGVNAAIVLQALSFGVQHLWGVPGGVMGAVQAGVWALMLGWLRNHSRGLLAPFLAHVVADTTIAVLVIVAART